MSSIEHNDDDGNVSMNNWEQIELTDPETGELHSESSATVSCSSSRLILLDGTYFKYVPEECTGNKITAICMMCPKDQVVKVKGYNNCTSNFLSHLKRKHGNDCIDEYKKYVKDKKSEGIQKETNNCAVKKNKSSARKCTQEQFDKNMVKYVIHSMIPLRSVEDPYFANIFSDLQISEMGLTLMSRRTLGRRIDSYYEEQVTDLKSELNKIDYVCTTLDIWSGKKKSFIGVTAHWITSDLRRVSAALACQRFQGIHSYDRISEIVQEINAEFGLDVKKIIASVTDNGSNFVKAFKVFGVKNTNIVLADESVQLLSELCPSGEEFSSGSDSELEQMPSTSKRDNFLSQSTEHINLLPVHLRCSAHTLNLCATTDANKILTEKNSPLTNIHSEVMKKCNILWKAAGRPKSAEIIQNVLQHTLSRPGETRWNSLFDALQQILNVKEKNLLLHRSLNLKNPLKDNEFQYLQEYLTCSGPVAEALDIMQSETNAYYGITLPCLLALRKKLRRIEKNNTFSYCKPLIKTYTQSVEKRFEEIFDIKTPQAENAAIAAFSYPRFKNKWLNCLEPKDRTKALKAFKTCISKEINQNEAAIEPKRSKMEISFFDFSSDTDSDSSMSEKTHLDCGAPLTKAELLMLHFFAEESQDIQLLENYPEIKSVFIKYNTPLPSSASVERLFSFATMTNLPKSHKISDNMFEKRVVLKCNLNYFKK